MKLEIGLKKNGNVIFEEKINTNTNQIIKNFDDFIVKEIEK